MPGADPDSLLIATHAIQVKQLNDIVEVETGYNHCRALAAGHDFSIAILDDGSVYPWEDNNFQQLGRHTELLYFMDSLPAKVDSLPSIIFCTSGARSYVVTSSHEVIQFGYENKKLVLF